MVSHLTAFISAASCVGLPWYFGYFSHASPEAQVISLLERQLERCGPENQTCPPCVQHDYCSWTTVTAAGLVGFAGGLWAAAAAGSVYLLCRFRQQSYGPCVVSPGSVGKTTPTSELQNNTFDLTSSPSDRRASSKSSGGAQRRRVRPAVPLAILSADQVRDL